MIGFGRLNHNSDFSFLHIKNPVGDFSPTGFVEQPQFLVGIGKVPEIAKILNVLQNSSRILLLKITKVWNRI